MTNFGKCRPFFEWFVRIVKWYDSATVYPLSRSNNAKIPTNLKYSSYQTLIKPSFVESCLELVCAMAIRVSQFLWRYFVKSLHYSFFLYILFQICLCINASTLFRIIPFNMMRWAYLIFAINVWKLRMTLTRIWRLSRAK